MKNIHFLVSLPRAGNTLLGCLLNQCKNIKVTPNSITPDIVYNLNKLKDSEIYNNFPDHYSLNNLIKNAMNVYYENWKATDILDRGPWGTPANLNIIKNFINKNPKFIILHRPLHECLNSLLEFTKIEDIDLFCNLFLFSEETIFGKNLLSIQNLISSDIPYLLITYDELINNYQITLNKIFDYLEIKKEKISFKKLKQFEINGIKYNDEIIGMNDLHTIETNKIFKRKQKTINKNLLEISKKYEIKFNK